MRFMKQVSDGEVSIQEDNATNDLASNWSEEYITTPVTDNDQLSKEWVDEHVQSNVDEEYNSQFWNKLQNEWKSLAESESDHPWISEFNTYYDSFKVFASKYIEPATETNIYFLSLL